MSKVTVSFELDISRLAALQGFLNGEVAPAAKKGPGRPKATEEEETTDSTEEDTDFSFEVEPEAPKKLTAQTIRERLKAVVDAGKEAQLKKLFDGFKIVNFSALDKSKYEKFYENLVKIKI